MGQFIRQLSENLEVLSGPSGSRLAANALDLVSTLLHAEMDIAPDRLKPQALLAVSVREYIEANLADPQPCRRPALPRRTSSRRGTCTMSSTSRAPPLPPGSGPSGWSGARRELRDPLHAGKPVGAVAARWGFLDAAHFSRTFRDVFGVSPSDWRRGAADQP